MRINPFILYDLQFKYRVLVSKFCIFKNELFKIVKFSCENGLVVKIYFDCGLITLSNSKFIKISFEIIYGSVTPITDILR